jgi:hypothetical protein
MVRLDIIRHKTIYHLAMPKNLLLSGLTDWFTTLDSQSFRITTDHMQTKYLNKSTIYAALKLKCIIKEEFNNSLTNWHFLISYL